MRKGNRLIEEFKGVKIRECNRVVLKLGAVEFKRILEEVDATGLSIHKILAYSTQPCQKCNDIHITAFDDNDNKIIIKKSLLSVPSSNGINIIKQHEKKHRVSKTN